MVAGESLEEKTMKALSAAKGAMRAATKVLLLLNMVDAKELEDEEEWHNIIEDVEEECEKFGKVLKVHVPRPAASGAPAEGAAEEKPVKGVGSIFVQFEEAAQTEKARVGLHGRMFQGKQVIAVFYNEDKFASGELEYYNAPARKA